jgi:uncharacterized membrane protein
MCLKTLAVVDLTLEAIHMSDQIIVATFNNTNAAYDAAGAIKTLKDKGVVDFKPKAGVMVKKDDKGNLSLLESKDRPLWGTGIGAVAGALIGATFLVVAIKPTLASRARLRGRRRLLRAMEFRNLEAELS